MKAYIVDRYGSSGGGLRAGDMPEPEVKEGDVLVQVHAAGVNALDSKIRDGEFKLVLPYRPPFILGNDVAGVVVRVGTRVRKFQPGDETSDAIKLSSSGGKFPCQAAVLVTAWFGNAVVSS